MSDDIEQGSGGVSEGALVSLKDLTNAELLAYPEEAEDISWKKTKYPVNMDEFRAMSLAADQADPQALDAMEDTSPDEDIDAEMVAFEQEGEVSEDHMRLEGDMAPESLENEMDLAPTRLRNFRGTPDTGWRPPDNTLGVGSNHVVTSVNVDMAGYSKNGTLDFRWPNMTTLFGAVTPAGARLFDPRVIYDHYARRWLIIIDAKRNSPAGSWIMVAASRTSDPGGAYYTWALDARQDGSTVTSNWADYTTVGIDAQGLYLGNNMFGFSSGFQYSKLRILNKAELYAGGNGANRSISWYDYWGMTNHNGSKAFTMQPCMHYRGSGGNPPAYLINALWPGGDELTMWKLSNPIGHWRGGSSSLTKHKIKCRRYALPPDAQQRGTSTRIETNDTRLLNAVYQFVGGKQRIWTSHTSKHTWNGDNMARSVVQWYEIDVPSKKVEQQNAYGARGKYYFFPAIQTDIRRNGYVLFGRSSSTEYGSLRYTGRRVNGPKNDLENSRLIKSGESSYTGGRWGDYFGICRDGDNSRRVWGYGEFAATRGRWGTWVAEMGY